MPTTTHAMHLGIARRITAFALLTCAALTQTPPHATQLNTSLLGSRVDMLQAGQTVHAWGSDVGGIKGSYFRSTDGGRTWPVRYEEFTDFGITAAAQDGDRIVLCGVYSQTSSSPTVVVSDDNGLSWSAPFALGSSQGSGSHIAAHIDGANVTVAWTRPLDGSAWTRHSTNGGQTWSTAVLLGNDPATTNPPPMSLQLLADGPLIRAFWGVSTPNSQGILTTLGWLQESSDAGQTWLPVRRVAPAPSSYARINAGGSGSDLYATSINGQPLYQTNNAGLNWTPVALGPAFDRVTDIEVQGDKIMVVAKEFNGLSETWTVAISTDAGSTWLNPALQVPAPTTNYSADVAIVDNDYYVHFYREHSPIYGLLTHSNDDGVTWRTIAQDIGTFSAGPDRCVFAKFVLPTPFAVNRFLVHAFVGHGWTPIGSGTAGTGGQTPQLAMQNAPLLGETVDFGLSNAVGNTVGVVGLSLHAPHATPFAGGTLWLQGPIVTDAFVTGGATGAAGAGSATVPFVIPNTPAAVGASITSQAVVIDSASTNGLAMTRAIEVWMR